MTDVPVKHSIISPDSSVIPDTLIHFVLKVETCQYSNGSGTRISNKPYLPFCTYFYHL
jgi:hypothetical protein